MNRSRCTRTTPHSCTLGRHVTLREAWGDADAASPAQARLIGLLLVGLLLLASVRW